MSSTKTIAFFGATGGCGLSALQRSMAAGHQCIALCRTPAKLTDKCSSEQYPNLKVVQGNAHDATTVAKCLVDPSDTNRIVDYVIFSIGGAFQMANMTLDDPRVCEKGAVALLEALAMVRASGATGRPRLIVVSSTGVSRAGRDVPLLTVPLYHFLLKVPHADKKILEEKIVGSGEEYTIVRPSLLVNGEQAGKKIRVGTEDWEKGVEEKAVGYTISREDVGRWIFEELVQKSHPQYRNKIVSITW